MQKNSSLPVPTAMTTTAIAALPRARPVAVRAKPSQLPINGFHNPISGQDMLLPIPARAAYLTLGRDFFRDLAPVGVREIQIVQRLVDLTWRVNRLGGIENTLLVSGMVHSARSCTGPDQRSNAALAQAIAWREDCTQSQSISRLGRYEAGLHRQIADLGTQFERLRSRRPYTPGQTRDAAPAPSGPLIWYQASLASNSAQPGNTPQPGNIDNPVAKVPVIANR